MMKKNILILIAICFLGVFIYLLNQPKKINEVNVRAVYTYINDGDSALSVGIIGGSDGDDSNTSVPLDIAEGTIVLFSNGTAKINYSIVLGESKVFTSRGLLKFYDDSSNIVDEVQLNTSSDQIENTHKLEKRIKINQEAQTVELSVEVIDENTNYVLESLGGPQKLK